MKIKEFEIRDYGPLPDIGLINLDFYYDNKAHNFILFIKDYIKTAYGGKEVGGQAT